jgi:hypothetical protein
MDNKVGVAAAVGALGVGCLFLFTHDSGERAGASVPKFEGHDLSTLGPVAHATPRAGLMVVRPEGIRLLAKASAMSPGHVQSDQEADLEDEVQTTEQPNVVELDDDARAESDLERAEQGLAALEAQDPDKFLVLFSMLEETRAYSPSALKHARDATRAYLVQRTDLLRRAWRSYLDSDGHEVASSELAQLADLEQAFRARMQSLSAAVPALGDVPDMIASTSHPWPFFANVVAPERVD